MDIERLDVSLAGAVKHLKDKWLLDGVGIVACAIVGPGVSDVLATSICTEGDKFRHAEHAALRRWRTKFGDSPIEAAVVTLSPCVLEKPALRDGPPCVSLLQAAGITRVHFGALDTSQGYMEDYRKMGFEVTITNDDQLSNICKALLGLFAEVGGQRKEGINPWPKFKRKISPRPFAVTPK